MRKNIKLIIIGIVAIAAIPLSCSDDVLDQVNPNAISTLSFWRDADDANLAVNGMYHSITGTFYFGRILHVGALLRSDAFNVIPSSTNTTLSTLQGVPGVARWATEPWQESYKAIFRANSIIENVNEENVPDADTRNGIIGQAYFIRAFVYWHLVNLYGNVPDGEEGGIPLIVKTPDANNNDELFPTQSTALAVWDLIIEDLEQAETLLPESWTGADVGRATSWAATALKGKSYLFRASLLGLDEYDDAEIALSDVVNNGPYDLLPGTEYQNNFNQLDENNVESVFELQFHPISGGFLWGVPDTPPAGTQGNFVIEYATPTTTPDEGHLINPWVRDLFEANGETVRRDATIAYDYTSSTVYDGVAFTTGLAADIALIESRIDTLDAYEGVEPIFTRKYSGLELAQGDVAALGDNYGPNWRVMRFSDVLLMLAEAINEQNRPSDAEQYINRVRTRANVATLTGLDQAGMRQAIIDERVLELTGEGHRFFDLVRWQLADDYLGTTSLHGTPHPKSISGGTFTPGRDELVWIPQPELDANPNLRPNPGY